MAPTAAQKCLQDGCEQLEEMVDGRPAGGYCTGHRYRKRRGLPMEPPLNEGLARRRPAHEALLHASHRLWDCSTDEASDTEFRRRVQLLVHAALVYARTRKEQPRQSLVAGPRGLVEMSFTVPTGVTCPHCKLGLVLVRATPPTVEEIAKEARLRLVQHIAVCPKKAR